MLKEVAHAKLPPRRLLAELAQQDIREVLAKNFHVVVPKLLYRSAQPERKEFIELQRKGCRSILNLRTKHSDLPKISGLRLKEYRLASHHLTQEDIVQALEIIRRADMPLLIHGNKGTDRTGVIVAAFRIVFQNWSVADALKEFQDSVNGLHRYIYRKFPRLIKRTDWAAVKSRVGVPVWELPPETEE